MRIPVLITGLFLAAACGDGESAATTLQPGSLLRVGGQDTEQNEQAEKGQ